jgi:hypothetical protein
VVGGEDSVLNHRVLQAPSYEVNKLDIAFCRVDLS